MLRRRCHVCGKCARYVQWGLCPKCRKPRDLWLRFAVVKPPGPAGRSCKKRLSLWFLCFPGRKRESPAGPGGA
jgi:hypothetical protein